jgi:hypothetical protein
MGLRSLSVQTPESTEGCDVSAPPPRPIVRRIVRWADNIAKGKTDLRQSFTKSSFVQGGTIGPAPGST